MGAGRRQTPTALKIVRGNPGKRPLNAAEPRPKLGEPPRPAWLSDRARDLWLELAPLLAGMRVLTRADGPALELLVESYADWREARDTVRVEGLTYDTETTAGGSMKRAHPACQIKADAWRRVRLALVEFGLTPSARAKVHAGAPDDEDPLDEFIGRRGRKG